MMADQDPQRLGDQLSVLTHWQRVAFAATCVEVLVPSYRRFSELEEVGDAAFVESAIAAVWAELERSDEIDSTGIPSSAAVLEFMPQEEDWNDWSPQAENAITALAYLTMLIREDDVQYAVYPAEHAYEAVDELVNRDPEPRMLDAVARAAVSGSAAIQAELERQEEVLRILSDSADGGRSRLGELRDHARRGAIGGP